MPDQVRSRRGRSGRNRCARMPRSAQRRTNAARDPQAPAPRLRSLQGHDRLKLVPHARVLQPTNLPLYGPLRPRNIPGGGRSGASGKGCAACSAGLPITTVRFPDALFDLQQTRDGVAVGDSAGRGWRRWILDDIRRDIVAFSFSIDACSVAIDAFGVVPRVSITTRVATMADLTFLDVLQKRHSINFASRPASSESSWGRR